MAKAFGREDRKMKEYSIESAEYVEGDSGYPALIAVINGVETNLADRKRTLLNAGVVVFDEDGLGEKVEFLLYGNPTTLNNCTKDERIVQLVKNFNNLPSDAPYGKFNLETLELESSL